MYEWIHDWTKGDSERFFEGESHKDFCTEKLEQYPDMPMVKFEELYPKCGTIWRKVCGTSRLKRD